MRKYKVVIFDWDGTVMDSAQKIISCMQLAAKQCDVPVPSDEDVGHIIGISLKPAIIKLFNLSCESKADALVDAYKQAFIVLDHIPSPLFEGAEQVLSELKQAGLVLAVATGKARRGLVRAWEQTNTTGFFTASRTADDAQSKPNPDMLVQLLSELDIKVEDAVMVGDTTYDMQMAQSIGMDRIAVSYGVHAQLQLEKHNPIAVVHTLSELLPLLVHQQ